MVSNGVKVKEGHGLTKNYYEEKGINEKQLGKGESSIMVNTEEKFGNRQKGRGWTEKRKPIANWRKTNEQGKPQLKRGHS